MTRLEGFIFLLPFLRAEHTCCLTAAILDFAKGAFFEANRGKKHTLYLYFPELLICVKGITEVVFYFVLVSRSKNGQRRNEDLLRIDNFFTSRAFNLIFCLMVLPLHRKKNNCTDISSDKLARWHTRRHCHGNVREALGKKLERFLLLHKITP